MSYYYRKGDHYNAALLKQLICNDGHDSPTRFLQDTLILNSTTANRKLNTGNFTREEIWTVCNALNLPDEDIVRVFLSNVRIR